MPLNFTGVIFVENVHEKDAAKISSPKFSTDVLAESSSVLSIPFRISVWVDVDSSMFPPVVDQIFHLDAKLSSSTDGSLHIEALRFFPLYDVTKVFPPFIIGTGLYLGRPEDGIFQIKCPTYANGTGSFILLKCYHSAKQIQNVAKTIQKNEGIFLSWFLHDTEGENAMVLKGSQFSYLSKAQKMVNTTNALLHAVKNSSDMTRGLMSPRKKSQEPTVTVQSEPSSTLTVKKIKRTNRKVLNEPLPPTPSDTVA